MREGLSVTLPRILGARPRLVISPSYTLPLPIESRPLSVRAVAWPTTGCFVTVPAPPVPSLGLLPAMPVLAHSLLEPRWYRWLWQSPGVPPSPEVRPVRHADHAPPV